MHKLLRSLLLASALILSTSAFVAHAGFWGNAWDTISGGASDRAWEHEQHETGGGGGGIRGLAEKEKPIVWKGSWVAQECTEAGGAVGIGCASRPSSGDIHLSVYPDRATIYLGKIKVLLTPVKDSDGSMHMGGWSRLDNNTDVTISNLDTKQTGHTMTGGFRLTFHPGDSAAGTVVIKAAISNMERVKAQ